MRAIFKNENNLAEFIKELQSILEHNKNLVLEDEMKTKRMKVRNCLYREQILIASYSLGASLNEIENLYSDTVNEICENWQAEIVKFKMGQKVLDQLYVYHHDSILRLISIGVLLDAHEELKKLKNKLKDLKISNCLFDKLISYKIPEHRITSKINSNCPTAFNKIEKLAFKEPIDEKSLIRHQINWYSTLNKNCFQWKDNHLNRGNIYFGYWSFSVAAIAKIASVNSDKLTSNVFFPTDMFLKRSTIYKYKISKEFKVLIQIDKLISKMGGVRRSTNEILALRKDILKMKNLKYEIIEKKVNEYIQWIRANYTHEVSLSELNPYFERINFELNNMKN